MGDKVVRNKVKKVWNSEQAGMEYKEKERNARCRDEINTRRHVRIFVGICHFICSLTSFPIAISGRLEHVTQSRQAAFSRVLVHSALRLALSRIHKTTRSGAGYGWGLCLAATKYPKVIESTCLTGETDATRNVL